MRFPWAVLMACLVSAVLMGERARPPRLKPPLPQGEGACVGGLARARAALLLAHAYAIESRARTELLLEGMDAELSALPPECARSAEAYRSRLQNRSSRRR
jgi:hypothetical protein